MSDNITTLDELKGKTFTRVFKNGDKIVFHDRSTLSSFALQHIQECCEEVYLADICGDLEDLQGSPITDISCRYTTYGDEEGECCFYNISTVKGSVTIRWGTNDDNRYGMEVSVIQQEPFTSFLLFPALLIRCFGLYRIESNKAL